MYQSDRGLASNPSLPPNDEMTLTTSCDEDGRKRGESKEADPVFSLQHG